jgi:predicted permease
VHDAEQLFALSTSKGAGWTLWPYASFAAWRDSQNKWFDVAASSDVLSVPIEPSEEARVRVSLVSGSYFRVMGVEMALGRAFADSEGRAPMADPVVVVSDAFWKRWFGGGADITGKSINLNGTIYEVIGVTRSPFTGDHVGHPTDVWAPISMLSAVLPGRKLLDDPFGIRRRWLRVVGRLHSGVSLEAAAASVNLTHQRVAAERAAALGETHPQVVRSRNQVVLLRNAASGYAPERGRYALPVQVLTGITGLLLLVACANFMNLILARSQSRRKEFAVRLALGAGRWRIVQQATIECVIIAAAAGALGLIVSNWATTATLNYFAAMIQPIELDYGLDIRVVAFAVACVALVVAFGLWPSLRPARSAAVVMVAQMPKAAGGQRKRAFGWRLVLIAQLAVCAALLIGAGLLFRTVTNLRSQDLGFDRNVILASISLTQPAQSGPAAEMLIKQVIERLETTPGIQAVGASGPGLLNDADYWIDSSQRLTTDRGPGPEGIPWTTVPVGPTFFQAVGMSLLHGRAFEARDTNPPADVVVINQTLRVQLFGEVNPVGRRIGMTADGPKHLVVGVVNDAKQTSPRDRGLGVVYVPYRVGTRAVLAVRTEGRATEAVSLVRSELAAADSLHVDSVRPITEVLNEAISLERLMSMLSLTLCALTMVVGWVGLYALVAYDVAQRTHEIGIRLALGATRSSVVSMILREGGILMMVGLACGVPLGILAMRPLYARLYGVDAFDPLTLLAAIVLLGGVTLLACWKPAHGASRVDPASLLRNE